MIRMVEHYTPAGRLYWRVDGVAYYSRKKAEAAVQFAEDREREHEIIARLAREAGERRRS